MTLQLPVVSDSGDQHLFKSEAGHRTSSVSLGHHSEGFRLLLAYQIPKLHLCKGTNASMIFLPHFLPLISLIKDYV